MSQTIQTERVGRRTYLTGNTFAAKEDIKAAGGHWDPDRKAWWLGDDSKAQAIASAFNTAPAEAKATANYRKLDDGSWGVRGRGLKAGGKVTVFKKSGERQDEVVKAILSTDAEGWQTATIEQRPAQRSYGNFSHRGGYGRRKACITGGNCSSFGSGRSCGGY